MASTQPLFMFGLEVPAGDVAIAGRTEIPYGFRITMAAIDPSAEPEGEPGVVPRATLKVIRQALEYAEDDDDDEYDEEDFDVDEMERMLAGEDDDDSEDDSEDEMLNGGPSDPAKSKAAKKAAANKAIRDMLASEEGLDVGSAGKPNGVNGIKKSAKALGKMRVSDDDEDEDSEEDDDDDDEDGEIEEFVICTLDPNKNYQQPLDITIREDERVWFKVSGTHTVYLTGNYFRDLSDELDDEDEDSEDGYDLEPDSDELDDELDGIDDDEEDELDDMNDPRITELEDDEDEVPALVATLKKAEKKGKNKRPAEEDVSMSLDDSITEAKKADANGEAKLTKKQQKKLKKNDGTPVAAAAAADDAGSATKSDKKVSFAKNLEQGPTPTKASGDDNKSKATPSLGVKVVQGVTVDDKKLGSGPAAKSGDRVSMRYIGKLQKDNSVFDKNTKGKPFSFKLGAGEVIKGWDIGIAGMSAGGERRITIPAHLAYGKQAQGPIPANSVLIFDVKALDIKKK